MKELSGNFRFVVGMLSYTVTSLKYNLIRHLLAMLPRSTPPVLMNCLHEYMCSICFFFRSADASAFLLTLQRMLCCVLACVNLFI